jgi:hypothetical protein
MSSKCTFGTKADSKLRLSKLEASRRQLETAIVLFFKGGDPVSIHTLATAAAEVIRDLNTACGGKPMAFDLPSNLVKPAYRSSLLRKLREAQNFFKHADQDPEAILEFNTELSVFILFDAIEKYCELSGETPPIIKVFSLWFRSRWPEAFFFTDDERRRISEVVRYSATTSKAQFFAEILPICFPVSSEQA